MVFHNSLCAMIGPRAPPSPEVSGSAGGPTLALRREGWSPRTPLTRGEEKRGDKRDEHGKETGGAFTL